MPELKSNGLAASVGANKELKEILSFFADGLGGLHEEMLEFFTKYSKGVIDSNFQRILAPLAKE